MTPFATRLASAIERTGKLQKAVAEEAGVSQAALTRYLKGDHEPGISAATKLASATGVDITWLLTGESISQPATLQEPTASYGATWRDRAERAEKELESIKRSLRQILDRSSNHLSS